MKKLLLFVSIAFISFLATAQKQTDNWLFGENAALDFTSGSPVVMNGFIHNIPEGCSSVSTASGTLLFYTDGVSVWDTTHTAMPNGTGLMGDLSTTQSALIVPSPASTSQYYIFTLPADGGASGFRYSLVDMTLNGSLGDVTTKNAFIKDSVTEKSAAVKDAAGTGYWIVVHSWGSDAFDAYHLTPAGIQPVVVSHTGIVYTTSAIQNTYGQMKFSTCGSKLAVAAGYLNSVEVFDFDITTGIVSNPITIPFTDHVYGIEFSKSSNFIYVSNYNPNATLVQYDISSGVTSTVIASMSAITLTPDIYALQIASNGKIYVVKSFSQFLGVINSPDMAGASCNYVDMGFDLDPNFMGNTSALGLPGFMQSYLNTDISCGTIGIKENENNSFGSVYPNPSADEFTFEFNTSPVLVLSPTLPIQLTIYDCIGRLLEKYNSVSSTLSFGKLFPKGIYFIHIKRGEEVRIFKLVKM